ncbi:MAG: PAS domain-containing protein, partial [Burkholderia sp.]
MPVSVVVSPLRDPGGRRGGAVAVLRDVSAEHERALANGMLHRLVDASPDAIIVVGADRRITSWNLAAQRIFGYPEADALGHDVGMLVPPRWLGRHPIAAERWARRSAVSTCCACASTAGGFARRWPLRRCSTRISADVALSLTLRDTRAQRRRKQRNHQRLRGARPIPRRIGISKRQRRRAICAEVRWTGSGAVGGQGFRQRYAISAANPA